jgi:hypothetical protein
MKRTRAHLIHSLQAIASSGKGRNLYISNQDAWELARALRKHFATMAWEGDTARCGWFVMNFPEGQTDGPFPTLRCQLPEGHAGSHRCDRYRWTDAVISTERAPDVA